MANDDKDFTFGKVDRDSSDDDWGNRGEHLGKKRDEAEEFFFASAPKSTPPLENDPDHPDAAEKAASRWNEVPPGGGNSLLTMVAGALVMILSAAGFYYFTTSPAPPGAVQKPVPEQPEETRASAPAATPERIEPTPPEPVAPQPTAPPEKANPEISIPPAPAPPVEFKPPSKPAVPPVKPISVKPAAAGVFVVQTGAFADPGNRDDTLAKLRKLGYAGKATAVPLTKPMTRLLVGVYPEKTAKRKLKDIIPIAENAFSLRKNGKLAVYAGSFSSAAAARGTVARLAKKGVAVTEERAKVKTTLWRITVPGFADRHAADAAARRIKTAGLEAEVFRNP